MKYKLLGIASVALFAATTFAEGMRPGLWESSTRSSVLSDMQETIATLPPAERKQMEDLVAQAIAAQYGSGTYIDEAGVLVMKACVTPEMAKLGIALLQPQQGNCALTASSRAGNTVKASFACTEPYELNGEVEATYQGDTAYSAEMTSAANGEIIDSAQTSGRWLNDDCGDLRPLPFIK